jgi:hypothetical protein
MVEIASGDCPTDHSTDILENSTCGDGCGLCVDYAGYVPSMKVTEKDVADHREDVFAQSAFNLPSGTVLTDTS